MSLSRIELLHKRAEQVRLKVDSYAPGDGVRRYRFMQYEDGRLIREIASIKGLKAAEMWIDAYREGYDAGRYIAGCKMGVM
jgi:hypothetical protein